MTWAATPSAFAELFTATWPQVCAYVARRTGRTGVEDVAAEVFAIAWRRRDELPRPPRVHHAALAAISGPPRGSGG